MTPFQARLVVFGFAALAAGISFNVLSLQSPQPAATSGAGGAMTKRFSAKLDEPSAQPHGKPGPVSEAQTYLPGENAGSQGPAQPGGAAAVKPHKMGSAAAEGQRSSSLQQAKAGLPPEVVQGIQRELGRRGYATGASDGVARAQTREAILAYQLDHGLSLTGEPSEALFKTILFGPVKAQNPHPSPSSRLERKAALVRHIQEALAGLGYSSGPVDGSMNEETRQAIRKFQGDRKMAETGRLTERLLLEIIIVTGQAIHAES